MSPSPHVLFQEAPTHYTRKNKFVYFSVSAKKNSEVTEIFSLCTCCHLGLRWHNIVWNTQTPTDRCN